MFPLMSIERILSCLSSQPHLRLGSEAQTILPVSAPGRGSIIRQPAASIIQRQVPEVVQSTIGLSESPAWGAIDGAVPSPASSDCFSVMAKSTSPSLPASCACALSTGISGQRDMARTAARNDLNNFSVGLAEALICSSPGAQFHLA